MLLCNRSVTYAAQTLPDAGVGLGPATQQPCLIAAPKLSPWHVSEGSPQLICPLQAKYTAKAEDKISEARCKPAQGPLNEELSVNRYNAMKAAAAAAINRSAGCLQQTAQSLLPANVQQVCASKQSQTCSHARLLICDALSMRRVSEAVTDTQKTVQDKATETLDQGAKVQLS